MSLFIVKQINPSLNKGNFGLKRPHRGWKLFILGSIFISLFNSILAEATSFQSTQSKASIGFYGQYISEMEPDPAPSDYSRPVGEKTDIVIQPLPEAGSLPRLNQLGLQKWRWIGLILTLIACYQIHSQQKKA